MSDEKKPLKNSWLKTIDVPYNPQNPKSVLYSMWFNKYSFIMK
jgi:hypothetical protein